jgi:selenocysteine lyase/cysteine desulfurase
VKITQRKLYDTALKELAALLQIEEKNCESSLAFCSNGTTGINTVLKSLPSIIPSKSPIKIICASTIYPAIYSTLLNLSFPAEIITVPIIYPISDDDYISAIASVIKRHNDIDFAVFDWYVIT